MKILGLLSILIMITIEYCAYNSLSTGPTNAAADVNQAGIKTLPSVDCKGPFGVDSQKILNKGTDNQYGSGLVLDYEYRIGIVTKIDLEKNNDGTWYIDNCELSHLIPLHFTKPYPQQNDFKVGDIIGFKATQNNVGGLQSLHSFYFYSGEMLENISLQSSDCKIDNMIQLSNPSKAIPTSASEKHFVNVTGVIMAIQTIKNGDPEPDDPSDYHIHSAVMKCADNNLYKIFFPRYYMVGERGFPIRKTPLQRAGQEAFREGDVITVKQISSLSLTINTFSTPAFEAYYMKNESK